MEILSKEEENQIATKILEICKESENGIQHDHLSRLIEHSEQKVVELLNQLIRAGYITVKQSAENIPVYTYQDPEKARKFHNLDRDSLGIYQLISDAQNNGLTINELKSKSGMNPKALDTILKNLKKRNLIKSEKALNQKNRNVWILFELEPSISVKGNVFYKKGEFDQNLVDALYNKIYTYIEKNTESQGTVSKKEILVALRAKEFASEDLRDEDIQSIINILVFDDKIEELGTQGYRVSEWESAVPPSVLTETPCGTCPVFAECKEGSMISPEKCIYFLQW